MLGPRPGLTLSGMPLDPERRRLVDAPDAWRRWGPYLSERAWGTVREDYSARGTAWTSFPHDHARSRAYRWSEDGLGGICDADQRLCLAFAFWNGQDPILKERAFGLTGDEGNHGEDVKELYWYLDSTPSHAWMRWRYVYPQAEFPYRSLVGHGRDRSEPELELMDTGVLDGDRYWDVSVEYGKAAADDVCVSVRVRNAGPEPATLHLLPTLWFRNTWSWVPDGPRPGIVEDGGALVARDTDGATMTLRGGGAPEPLFCDNDTNNARLWPDSAQPTPPFPKDGINDHVVAAAATVNPARTGTKAALWYQLDVPAGQTAEVRLRLSPEPGDLGRSWTSTLTRRAKEADGFYASLAPAATPDEHAVMRQAFGGMLWSKQYYHYDVERWLAGDPGQPEPPPERLAAKARNAGWRHVDNRDIISMPDTWEYPWFAAWDLAFHCITLAHVDPAFAKAQLRLITREWYMHPNGQLPAYEWNFGDVNPPVHALAALAVYQLDGATDREWLQRLFHKLLLGFTWWANVKDPEGNLLFGGGFLGMDNVGPFNRSDPLPEGLALEQADGTGWMALYCLSMLEMALVLAEEDPAYEDVAIKFFEHFTMISKAINDHGLWDEDDAFYYDRVRKADGTSRPVRVRSMTGLIPLCAVATAQSGVAGRMPELQARVTEFLADRPEYRPAVDLGDGDRPTMLALVGRNRLPRILERLAGEDEFLSPHGIRSLSAAYRGHPFAFTPDGGQESQVDYEPAESTTTLFGGNSNWRGPVWFPVNHLIIHALRRYARGLGSGVTIEYPAGSGREAGLDAIAADLAQRLVGIFLPDPADGGRRPVFGNRSRFRDDPAWTGDLLFHEYFHGDTGAGLGASHQTGWTGLVADLVIQISDARERAAG
ncbi:MAG: glucosidase [Conexibacter sp.]|nr:glucosidase [Conexibacter sp.]